MRDINRIEPFLSKFEELWRLYPDLRFGQLVTIIGDGLKMDMFDAEERDWVKRIEILLSISK